MRFDTPIYFQSTQAGEYDPSTGNYGEDRAKEVERYANVTSAGVDMLNLIYGKIKQGILVLRLQNHYDMSFDRIRVGKKAYRVDFCRSLRNKQIFIVSEVQ